MDFNNCIVGKQGEIKKNIRAILYHVALVGFSWFFYLSISAENYLQCHVTTSKMNLLIQGNKPIFDRTSIIDTLVVFFYWTHTSANNLLSYFGLFDAKMSNSDKGFFLMMFGFLHFSNSVKFIKSLSRDQQISNFPLKDLFMSCATLFSDVSLGWYYNISGWKLIKQTSYWSKKFFFLSVKNHHKFSSQNNVRK